MSKHLYSILLIVIFLEIVLLLIRRDRKKKRKKAWDAKFSRNNQIRKMSKGEEAGQETEEEKNHLLLKIQMYIISLWLLFVLIIPLTVSPVSTKELSAVKEWYNLITILVRKNVLPLICLAMALFGLILFKQLEYRWKGTKDLPVQVTNVEFDQHTWYARRKD